MMTWKLAAAPLAALALAACQSEPQQTRPIKVRSAEQNQLHELDAMNLAIALKRAIYDAGYTCKRITDAGFVGEWKNNDMWFAHCEYESGAAVDWAVFAGPDGSAQVRNCKDITPDSGVPACKVVKRPKGDFNKG